jgi:hypothetical protein
VAREIEWTSLVGDFWKIPHDNRLNFCFRAPPPDDEETLVHVRNFLYHFHRQEYSRFPNGKVFHVWDWFDTGLSAYWHPGRKPSELPTDALKWSTGDLEKRYSNSFHLSNMIAPWRRIMFVLSYPKAPLFWS